MKEELHIFINVNNKILPSNKYTLCQIYSKYNNDTNKVNVVLERLYFGGDIKEIFNQTINYIVSGLSDKFKLSLNFVKDSVYFENLCKEFLFENICMIEESEFCMLPYDLKTLEVIETLKSLEEKNEILIVNCGDIANSIKALDNSITELSTVEGMSEVVDIMSEKLYDLRMKLTSQSLENAIKSYIGMYNENRCLMTTCLARCSLQEQDVEPPAIAVLKLDEVEPIVLKDSDIEDIVTIEKTFNVTGEVDDKKVTEFFTEQEKEISETVVPKEFECASTLVSDFVGEKVNCDENEVDNKSKTITATIPQEQIKSFSEKRATRNSKNKTKGFFGFLK